MACLWKLFVLLVPIFLGLISEPHLTFVSGDAALIKDVCSKTTGIYHCKICFAFYKRSSHEDVKALGRTSIDCSYSELDMFRSSLGGYVVHGMHTDFEKACGDCLIKIVSVDRYIKTALLSWQRARYADSANQMLAAQQVTRDCGLELVKFQLPKALATQLDAVMGFCEASNGVLKQIH